MTPRDLRRALGLTQAAFAKALGVSLRTVQSWDQGRRQPGRWALLCLAELANENPKRENRGR